MIKKIKNLFRKDKQIDKTYNRPDNEVCVVCAHVLAGEKITLASVDEEGWQFLCGQERHSTKEAKLVGLGTVKKIDASIVDIVNAQVPSSFFKKKKGNRWLSQ